MKNKKLKIERFLEEMNAIMPWEDIKNAIKPFYKSENGRKPHDLEKMLRIYCLQLWYNMSDPATEEAIYDRLSFQKFIGFDCFGGVVPDESSICRFRHLIEKYNLSKTILFCVNDYLAKKGLIMKEGTIVDATIFQAPVSKKNSNKERDPEMSSTMKNNKWYFGAKGHIGVQANGKPIIHSCILGTAKEHDIKQLNNLLHGEELAIFGDSAYNKNGNKKTARANNVYYGIIDKGRRNRPLSASQKKKNKKHSRLRAKVEHPFRIIKHLWGNTKLKYKGLIKNNCWFTCICAFTNLFLCRKELITG